MAVKTLGLAMALSLASPALAAPSLQERSWRSRSCSPRWTSGPRPFPPMANTIVYVVRVADYRQVLVVAERKRGRWGEPRVAPFSGIAYDGTPSFSPDGRRLFFASDRDGKGDFDIWTVVRRAKGWGEPSECRRRKFAGQ